MIYRAINSEEFEDLSEKIRTGIVDCDKVGKLYVAVDCSFSNKIFYLVNCEKGFAFKVNDENSRLLLFEDEVFDNLPKKFLRGMTVAELRQTGKNGYSLGQDDIAFDHRNNETIIWWSIEPQRIGWADFCKEADGEPYGEMLNTKGDVYVTFNGYEVHLIDEDSFPYPVRITFEARVDEFCRLLCPIKMMITRKDGTNSYITATYTSESKIVDVVRSSECPRFGADFGYIFPEEISNTPGELVCLTDPNDDFDYMQFYHINPRVFENGILEVHCFKNGEPYNIVPIVTEFSSGLKKIACGSNYESFQIDKDEIRPLEFLRSTNEDDFERNKYVLCVWYDSDDVTLEYYYKNSVNSDDKVLVYKT